MACYEAPITAACPTNFSGEKKKGKKHEYFFFSIRRYSSIFFLGVPWSNFTNGKRSANFTRRYRRWEILVSCSSATHSQCRRVRRCEHSRSYIPTYLEYSWPKLSPAWAVRIWFTISLTYLRYLRWHWHVVNCPRRNSGNSEANRIYDISPDAFMQFRCYSFSNETLRRRLEYADEEAIPIAHTSPLTARELRKIVPQSSSRVAHLPRT